MKFSKYFLPTLRDTPSDAAIASHIFMLRAGLISQTASGIYSWLPMGLRILEKIQSVIDEEHYGLSQKICMSTIQPAELWLESNRYDSYGKEMLRIEDRKGGRFLYSPTSEEQATDIFRKYVKSYRHLPINLYQIQWKFRDEIRPRFGVMRGREFLMKDGYSFDIDIESAKETYKRQFECYLRIFKRLGLSPLPVLADSGAIGGNMSHEFHILASTGENTVYFDKKILGYTEYEEFIDTYAVSDEKYSPEECSVPEADLLTSKSIEVGHIFYFGTRYTESMNVFILGKQGEKVYPEMGSYGIGVSRLIGAIIESSHDEKGIIWPREVSPFDVHLINLHHADQEALAVSDDLYHKLTILGIDVLYDDRSLNPGEKLMDADLIGIPTQIIIGKNKIKEGVIDVKDRKTSEITTIPIANIMEYIRDRVWG